MSGQFRVAMSWVHTWFGLVLGFVLMVVFFFGSLSVFDREIDRWAMPATRFDAQVMPSFDKVLLPAFQRIAPDADEYASKIGKLHDPAAGPATPRMQLPADEYWAYTTHRDPVLAMGVGFRVPQPLDPDGHNHIHGSAVIDPRSGEALRDDQLKIGSKFFYPLHYKLHINWLNLGYWLVGLAALMMLAALVTGVIIHRKLFRELFTFRVAKAGQRRTLDLHNLSGVVALPFHFFFAFTGLVIFASIYLPVSHTMLKPLHDAHEVVEAQATGLPHERAGAPAPLASVDAMMTEAKRRWAARDMAGEVGFLQIHHLGDKNSYVSIYRAGSDRVALVGEAIHFQASTGKVLHEEPPASWLGSTRTFLTGLHLQHFEHWPLRWLYLFGGLLGCVCLATGFVFFIAKRRRQTDPAQQAQARFAEILAVATVTGMLLATAAILLANRLLPEQLLGKGDWEQRIFWLVWLAALLHAAWQAWRPLWGGFSAAWWQQAALLALLAPLAAVANWWTTGDHLGQTLFQYWPVAAVDLGLILSGVAAGWVALHLYRRQAVRGLATVQAEVVHG